MVIEGIVNACVITGTGGLPKPVLLTFLSPILLVFFRIPRAILLPKNHQKMDIPRVGLPKPDQKESL